MFNFYKYQSLGNKFILFDWQNLAIEKINQLTTYENWQQQVKQLCKENAVDGILILKNAEHLTVDIFNADGSNGGQCFNGLRCVADYLITQKNHPKQLEIKMGGSTRKITVDNKLIILEIDNVKYSEAINLNIENEKFIGHTIDCGNPHFVILQQVTKSQLETYGPKLESHPKFPNRTNVEFLWQTHYNEWQLLVYERGSGITQSCGTGAAAAVKTLQQTGQLSDNEEIIIHMSGGKLVTQTRGNSIIQQAAAELIASYDKFKP